LSFSTINPMNAKKKSKPLDGHAHEAFVSLMTLAGGLQQQVKDRMRVDQPDGLQPLHLRLLCLCVEQPDNTQQQFAKLLRRDKGQVAHLIHALEARGLLTRTPDPQDGRVLRMRVTELGAEAAQLFVAMETELAQGAFGALTQDQLVALCALTRQLLETATPADTRAQ
jgi:DNA-binding MarR family transcriptional regulator